MKKLLEIGLVVGIVVIAVSLFTPLAFLNRQKYRDEIRTLYHRLEVGMTKNEVRQTFDAGDFPNLRFHQRDERMWSAAAPLEFGAQNWVLYIEFGADRVTAVRVRTEDSDRSRPSEAPEDKVVGQTAAPELKPASLREASISSARSSKTIAPNRTVDASPQKGGNFPLP